MKHTLFTALLVSFLFNLGIAQTALVVSIKGTIIDSAKNQPLGYVTISLTDAATGLPVKSTLSKDDGTFELNSLPVKNYRLTLVNLGYRTKTIGVNQPGKAINLGQLLLQASTGQLNQVTVTGARPLMKREVDRLSYDVQADPENKVLTVLDMMRRVPLLSVDATDNIKLQGNGNYKILINGKPSALVARNPADVFRAMPASNIQKIEVITTPPAKYDAEGLAGIINIITKKDIDQGYNGSFNTRYSNLWGFNNNLNLTVKQGKFGLGGYAGVGRRNTLTNNFQNINESSSLDDNQALRTSYLKQLGSTTASGINRYATAELSFESDSLNLLTGTLEFYNGNNNNDRNLASALQNGFGTGSNAYRSLNTNNSGYSGLGLGLNYQLGFKRNKDQLLTASYKYNLSKNKQFNDVQFTERVQYDMLNYQQNNHSGTGEHTLQVDYVQPAKMITTEAGAKAIFRNNNSDSYYNVFNAGSNQYITDNNQTNIFDYRQNVYSLYNSYQFKFSEKWVAKGGARLEHTTVNANAAVRQRYSNLVPSLSIQRSFKSSSVNLGYTDRIQRPGLNQLNPFVNRTDPNFTEVGNPNLRPVVNHNVELTYSNFKKGSFNLGINYKFSNNNIENVTAVNPVTAASVTTYQNAGSSKRLGADLNITYPITTKLNININSELVRVWLKGYVNSTLFSTRGYQGHMFSNANYKFDNGYRISAEFNYDSRYVFLQGRDNYWLGYAASASKEFLNKKATLSVNVNTPFQRIRTIDNTIRTPSLYQLTLNELYARAINISFNYKFGKLNSELKKNQRGINNDDVGGTGRN